MQSENKMELKKRLLSYYGWFEFAIIILAFIAPYFLKPAWMCRLILVYLVLWTLLIEVIKIIFYPQMMFQKHVDINKVSIYKKLFGYIAIGIGLILMIWYVFLPMTIDIYITLVKNDQMITSIVNVEDTQYGGAISPYFIDQSLKFKVGGELRTYQLPFYKLPLAPGTYELVYSPRTYFVWDVIRKIE